MSRADRQANQRFLVELIDRFADSAAKQLHLAPDYLAYLKDFESHIEDSPRRGWALKLRDKILSGIHYFDNPIIQDVLLPISRRHMPSDFALVESIPIGFLPSRTLNGFVACGPNGECAIILNDHINFYAESLFRAFFGYASWYSSSPYSRSLPQEAFATGLVALALYNLTRRDDYLKWLSSIVKEETQSEDQIGYACIRVLLFILLHEYGHIVKGHLDYSNTSLCLLAGNNQINVFNRNQLQEFEADIYASERMLSLDSSTEQRKSFLLTIGVLMRFIDLCERIRSEAWEMHPPAIDRWLRIKADVGIVQDVERLAVNEVDAAFDTLLEGLRKAGVFK